jgi:pimeloyl-ACP methyl ester carboxylesterase
MDNKHRDRRVDAPDRPIRNGRVGLIVAGSAIIGLVVSLALVIGPFGGAQEHVIMGTALLAWAIGWALLAVLSIRWSDQPQRWAVVPAALMALAGASLLIFKPDANAFNALGWIWPPALIALAVWMTLQARNLRSIARRLVLYPLLAGILLAGIGGGYETIQEQVDRSTTAMPGHLVDVGGRRLYLECSGSGSPTVVLVSGLAEASVYWQGWIAPAVAQNTTVCVYDRAGQGWSDPPPSPQDGAAVATDLHNLLVNAQIPGPYVVVGHSTGGVYARIFAARYPDQVAGMVLLDSQPNEALTGGLPNFPSQYNILRRATALFPSLARLGVFQLVNRFAGDPLPVPIRDQERAVVSAANLNRIQRDEFANLPATLKEAADLTTLGNRPLIVVTAVKGADAGWLPLQDKMVGLSTNSLHRLLPDTDHPGVIHDKAGAAVASQAILDVVSSVRSGAPLPKS